MTKFIRVENGLLYSEVSIIQGLHYFAVEKSIYKNDSLTEYIRFRSEGGVSYSREELELDTSIKSEFKVVLRRKIEISDKSLIDNQNQFTIDRIHEDSVLCQNNNNLFLYQILK